MAKSRYDPSVDRQCLSQALEELAVIFRTFCRPEPAVSGGLVVLRRRCGKTPCRCNRGELHQSSVYLDRTTGKRKIYKSTPGLRGRLRAPLGDYRRLRQLRVRLGKLHREVVSACDRLRIFRLQEGARLVARVME